MSDLSAALVLARRLVAELGRDGAHRVLRAALVGFTATELAALGAHWPFWAMPKQLPPPGAWRSWTRLGARGTGKTLGFSHFVNAEVEAGRAGLVGLAAQNEDLTIGIQVEGPSGLLATAPPWFRPTWHASTKTVHWPNGARGYARTPEVPGAIRGVDYHLSWLSEIQSWPGATMREAFDNFALTTRRGYARTIVDCTHRRRHVLVRELVARSEAEPAKHVITRGTIRDNPHLGAGVVEDLVRQIGLNTVRGREELLGEMVDDEEALIRAEWIDRTRRHMPETVRRRAIACDPAITSDPRFSDRSGIVDMAAGVDGQLYACRNLTERYRAEDLGGVLVDAYLAGRCDLLVIETNRGGDSHVALVRVAARARGQEVVVVGTLETPVGRAGTIYVRPVNNRGKKAERLSIAAALLERRVVSFVIGGPGLEALEEQLLALSARERGPDDAADAFAMACVELSDAARDAGADAGAQLDGLAERVRDVHARVDARRGPEQLGDLRRFPGLPASDPRSTEHNHARAGTYGVGLAGRRLL